MTVSDAIRELEKIEMVRRNNGTYRLDHAVTKKQKAILHAFDLDADYVRLKATEIGLLLSNGNSLLNTTTAITNEIDEHAEKKDYSFN